MAFRKLFSKGTITNGYRVPSPAATLDHSSSPIKTLTTPQNNAPSKTNLQKELLTGESVDKGFFRRFLHRRAVNQLPELLSIPVGEKLREKLKGFNISRDRLHLDGLTLPGQVAGDSNTLGVSVENAKKILRVSMMERLKEKLREIPKGSIWYPEFVKVCVDECGNEDQGAEFAKLLEQSLNVIVLGNIVYLRPEQVAKSMEHMISQTMATPSDPRRKQLEHMEKLKEIIDKKARTQPMAFFLRTSTEPSFEGFFQRRFKTKQKKLMMFHGFDVQKYHQLRKVFYPSLGDGLPQSEYYKPEHPHHEDGALVS
ncbi:hypothetical protein OIU84_015773 [Salix udensis]|uniref:Calcium uniporter protein C-terminal domain-containing protein n=1 Tax=Salix udensis TaxID=889485 RepID=A0AAD6NNW8_9ROSI|nr:hypothetical protein OIU84_015773 [Salix udensis]